MFCRERLCVPTFFFFFCTKANSIYRSCEGEPILGIIRLYVFLKGVFFVAYIIIPIIVNLFG